METYFRFSWLRNQVVVAIPVKNIRPAKTDKRIERATGKLRKLIVTDRERRTEKKKTVLSTISILFYHFETFLPF